MNYNTVEEIWEDIEGFEGLYRISNLGRVYSLTKDVVMKGKHNNRKYVQITLTKNGKQHYFLLHRLVASHFIDNPEGLPQVNHKDENKENNAANNLEWCTNKYNAHYGTRIERTTNNEKYRKSREEMKRKVIAVSTDGEVEIKLNSIKSAKMLGFSTSKITDCCRGKCEIYKGFKWEYID